MVRYRFNLTRHQAENLKKWVVTKCQNIGLETFHLSTFVVACSFLWVCIVKLKSLDDFSGKVIENSPSDDDFEDIHCFGFLMDLRNRFELSIPSTYFGNCLSYCLATLPKRKLLGENGICEAANVIGREISLKDPLKKDKEFNKSLNMIRVIGSPKFDVYETDFGLGKPVLTDVINNDELSAFCLSDSKDEYCGIEVAMVLERAHVKKFSDILEVQLRDIVSPVHE